MNEPTAARLSLPNDGTQPGRDSPGPPRFPSNRPPPSRAVFPRGALALGGGGRGGAGPWAVRGRQMVFSSPVSFCRCLSPASPAP